MANVIAEFLEPFTSETISSHKVICNRESNFGTIWNDLLSQLGSKPKDQWTTVTPHDVLNALPSDRKLILIVDEFDRLQDPDTDAMFADTVKAISDKSVDTTLILVGVADDVDDLITEHASIDRCLVQIHLDRMGLVELKEIIEAGMKQAGMDISNRSVNQICLLSMGLPHYTHAFGLNAGRAAIDRRKTRVTPRDVDEASLRIISEYQQTSTRQFIEATASPRRENYYFQVLVACALAKTNALGFFRAQDIRDPYSRIMDRPYEIPSFSRHLHNLSTEARGAVLLMEGEAHKRRFRFNDPMLQPYVLIKGLQSKLITLNDIRRWNPNAARTPGILN